MYIDCKCCLSECNCFIPEGVLGRERGGDGSGLQTFAVYGGKGEKVRYRFQYFGGWGGK